MNVETFYVIEFIGDSLSSRFDPNLDKYVKELVLLNNSLHMG